MAFVNHLPIAQLSSRPRSSRTTVKCSANPGPNVCRRNLLSIAAAATIAKALQPTVTRADDAGGAVEKAISKVFFPKEGFNAGDKPLGGTLDRSILETSSGKAALATLKKYQSEIDQMYTDFKSNPQVPLSSRVGKLNISELRDALNTFGEAFDEDAQRETDRVVRNIIQDIGELQAATVLREGAVRTERKIQRTTDWFEKVTTEFSRLVSFCS